MYSLQNIFSYTDTDHPNVYVTVPSRSELLEDYDLDEFDEQELEQELEHDQFTDAMQQFERNVVQPYQAYQFWINSKEEPDDDDDDQYGWYFKRILSSLADRIVVFQSVYELKSLLQLSDQYSCVYNFLLLLLCFENIKEDDLNVVDYFDIQDNFDHEKLFEIPVSMITVAYIRGWTQGVHMMIEHHLLLKRCVMTILTLMPDHPVDTNHILYLITTQYDWFQEQSTRFQLECYCYCAYLGIFHASTFLLHLRPNLDLHLLVQIVSSNQYSFSSYKEFKSWCSTFSVCNSSYKRALQSKFEAQIDQQICNMYERTTYYLHHLFMTSYHEMVQTIGSKQIAAIVLQMLYNIEIRNNERNDQAQSIYFNVLDKKNRVIDCIQR